MPGFFGGLALRFQVYADFSFTHGKQQLISTAIYCTTAACTLWPIQPEENSYLTISRIFPTLHNAKSNIAYLHGVYPNSLAPPPVLDSGQKEFFLEVSK
jgi:hypothetical protein